MPRVEFIAHIHAPPQAVWDFISDIRRGPEWVTVMKEVLFVSDEPIKKDSVYRERSQVAGSMSETEWHITEFDPPRRQVHKDQRGNASGCAHCGSHARWRWRTPVAPYGLHSIYRN